MIVRHIMKQKQIIDLFYGIDFYGIYIILMKNSKKVLVNDEGNIFKMIPNKLKEIFDSYPNFFEQSKSELNKFSDKYLY